MERLFNPGMLSRADLARTYVAGSGDGRWRCTQHRLVSAVGPPLWAPPFMVFHTLSKIPLYNLYISPTRAPLSSSKRVVARDDSSYHKCWASRRRFHFLLLMSWGPALGCTRSRISVFVSTRMTSRRIFVLSFSTCFFHLFLLLTKKGRGRSEVVLCLENLLQFCPGTFDVRIAAR